MNARDDDDDARSSDRLVATLVHDLRNPLAALAGNLALLREELVGVELTRHANASLDDCDALVRRALGLITSIVDADALSRGAIEVRPAPVRLVAEIATALASVDAAVVARELTIERAVDDALVIEVDVRLFGCVLGCLLDNAVRFAPRRGLVAIRAERRGAEVEFAIGNSGPPLTPDERARVFEREFRAAERTAAARRGRGLGLHFCRLVAEAHGGSITASARPGLPVEFVIRLPLAAA